jgi:hypothetical protein
MFKLHGSAQRQRLFGLGESARAKNQAALQAGRANACTAAAGMNSGHGWPQVPQSIRNIHTLVRPNYFTRTAQTDKFTRPKLTKHQVKARGLCISTYEIAAIPHPQAG